MQVTKTLASCKVFVYVLLHSHKHSLSFQTPTYWNCHFHERLLPDEVFQWWYFFLFLGAVFANIPPTFLISCEIKDIKIFWTVPLKPFIRYQGKNSNLFWICYFQFFFHCLVQPNQSIHFLFQIIFIIRIRLWIF